jgi:hypothetical protein
MKHYVRRVNILRQGDNDMKREERITATGTFLPKNTRIMCERIAAAALEEVSEMI